MSFDPENLKADACDEPSLAPSSPRRLPSVSLAIVPSFHDADPMNVVWHGNYLRFFEKAREALFKSIDYDYAAMSASGYVWPIIRVEVDYRAPMLVEHAYEIRAAFEEFEHRVVIRYEVRDTTTGKRLTVGRTVQMAVNAQTQTGELMSPRILFEKLGVPYPCE